MWTDGYRDQIVTMLHSVMWVCLFIPKHIHCSCNTVMALLCIPVSELVSLDFSTIPITIIMSLFIQIFFFISTITNVSRTAYTLTTTVFLSCIEQNRTRRAAFQGNSTCTIPTIPGQDCQIMEPNRLSLCCCEFKIIKYMYIVCKNIFLNKKM